MKRTSLTFTTLVAGALVGTSLSPALAVKPDPAPPAAAASISSLVPARGPASGGTTVSLQGANLSGVSAVKVNGVVAPNLVVESNGYLRFDTPAGTVGNATVVVVKNGNASAGKTFTRLSNTPPPAQRAAVAGLMDRKDPTPAAWRTEAGKPLVKASVINIRWDLVEADGPDKPLKLAAIKDDIDAASAAGMQVRLRIFAGADTPLWLKNKLGTMSWGEGHTGTLKTYQVPKWWQPAYAAEYERFMKRLEAEVGSKPSVREVSVSTCMTVYAEPLQRQAGTGTNAAKIAASDYSYQQDLACQYRSIDATAAIWPKQRVSFAFNPFKAFDAPAVNRKTVDVLSLMEYGRKTLGDRFVAGNHSLRSKTNNTITCPNGRVVPDSDLGYDYNLIYCALEADNGPVYFQTARGAAIVNWQQTLDAAVKYGAGSVELNSEYKTYDRSTLLAYGLKLRANAS